jgi:M6 family metalloprotease-like protein
MKAKSNTGRDYCYRRSYFAMLVLVLAAILSSRVTYGFDPDIEGDFEPVDQYRRRMGIEYGYKTRVLSPELCRDSSESECEEMEDSFIEQATNLRELQNTKNGDVNIVVLLIRFSDHANRILPSPSDIDLLFNDPGETGDITPTGSIKTYLAMNSYDKFRINAVISPSWVDAAGSESSCAGTTKGVNDQFMNCFAPALDALEESFVNWWDFDLDGDGSLDAVIVLHSGYATSQGKTDEDGVDSSKRIQSHARSAPQPPWVSPSTGISLGIHNIISVYRGVSDQKITRLNVISHETLHLLGAIDIYDISLKTFGAGGYALMAYPYGHTGTLSGATTPGHVCPWVKMEVGWLEPIEITQDGTYSARPSLTTQDIYKISAPYPDGEYLLIENRPAIEWDAALGGGGGIVIWSIDENIEGNTENGLEVVVLQADGKFDLENNNNFGDEGDFFVTGRELPPTGAVSSKSRRTGASNGIRIYNFSPPGSKEGFFTVENLAPGAPTPAPVQTPTVGPILTSLPTTASPTQAPTISPTKIPNTTTTPAPTLTPTIKLPPTSLPTTPTQVPTSRPISTPAPTVAPPMTNLPTTASLTQPPGKPDPTCLVSVGTYQCSSLVATQTPVGDCNCYNYCDGEFLGCSPYGEPMAMNCQGSLVAGCEVEEEPPVPAPETECLLTTSTDRCGHLVEAQTPMEDCDCYNYCDGQFLGCCASGEFCTKLSCPSGSLVAGCQLEPDFMPTKAPTGKQSFFFWPNIRVPTKDVPTAPPTKDVPTAPPTKAPTRKQSFFFWP